MKIFNRMLGMFPLREEDIDGAGGAGGAEGAGSGKLSDQAAQAEYQAFLGGFDETARPYIESSGIKSTKDIVTKLQAADKFKDVDLNKMVSIPDFATAKPEDLAAFYGKLGRPEKAEDYQLSSLTGGDEFAKSMAPVLHEIGLSKAQAAKLNEKWNQYVASKEETYNTAEGKKIEALKAKWGADFDKNVEISRQVAKAFGWGDPPMLAAMEKSYGSDKLLEGLFEASKKIGDDSIITGNGGKTKITAGMSPEAAAQKYTELKKNSDWISKFAAGEKEATAEFNALQEAIAKGKGGTK